MTHLRRLDTSALPASVLELVDVDCCDECTATSDPDDADPGEPS